MSAIAQTVRMFGGSRVVGGAARSWDELARHLDEGVEFAAFERVGEAMGASALAMAAVLGMSARTLQRRRDAGRLHADEAHRLYRLVRVFLHARETFGGDDAARAWLHESNRALGGRLPFELLATDIGSEQVDATLTRIDYGVFS